MGLQDSWDSEEDLSVNQPTSFAIPLPPIPPMDTFIDSTVDNGPFSDIDCLFSPMDQGLDGQEDTPCESGEAGVCGLRNLGNTCFVSAGVQCLVATPPLVEALVEGGRWGVPGPLTQELVTLARKIWSGSYSSLHPAAFKASLSARYPQFNDYRQHDCQEFLALLLDALHEQLNTAVSKDFACQVEPREFHDDPYSKEASTSKSWLVESTTRQDTNVFGESSSKIFNKGNNKQVAECNLKQEYSKKDLRNEQLNNMIERRTKGLGEVPLPGVFLNNAVGHLSGLGDILKEAKTSNVNVLDSQQEANNEIRFDSEKYPRSERRSHRDGLSFNSFHQNYQGKRCKNFLHHNNSAGSLWREEEDDEERNSDEGLDLKRVKLRDEEDGVYLEKNPRAELERRNNQQLLDKNYRLEFERKEAAEREKSLLKGVCEDNVAEEVVGGCGVDEGEKHWASHLAANRSPIVDTFQGQFRSTVVCSSCGYVSVTYEPFMYLSVPLPNALRKQICVTLVRGTEVTDVIVEVGRNETVGGLKLEVIKKMAIHLDRSHIIFAQVLDHHITKILDDSYCVRDLNDTNRSLYAFELTTVETISPLLDTMDSKTEQGTNEGGERSCTICLEDKDVNMRAHIGCTCLLCDICIMASCQHYGGDKMECPLCRREANPETDFIPLQPASQVAIRLLNIPVVYRVDETGDGNNNKKTIRLFGHPSLLRLPNRIGRKSLHKAIAPLLPYQHPHKLLLVDGQGKHCARCMYGTHCTGCEVKEEEGEDQLLLYSSDSLGIAFPSVPPVSHPLFKSSPCPPPLQPPLTLYDCIRAFSQSEVLDEQNPWYCPKCRKNQCATKTLSIWRYPEYLIVYLKRFIFHDQMSTKLEDKVIFPLCGLKLGSSVPLYSLYACVCHSGGVSGGHYTTYAQHPISKIWHYFNDSYVSTQAPQEEDYSSAYILFYRKQSISVPDLDLGTEPVVLSDIH